MASTTSLVAVAEPNSPCAQPIDRLREHDLKVGDADMLLKLMMVSASVATKRSSTGMWRGRQVVDDFNNLLSRIMSKEIAACGKVAFDDDDVETDACGVDRGPAVHVGEPGN